MLPPTAAGQTKGCALVRYGNVETATWVLENLHSNIPQGLQLPISVRFADRGPPRKEFVGNRPAPYPGGATAPGQPAAIPNPTTAVVATPCSTVLVLGLPSGVEQLEVQRIMEQYGNLASVKVLPSTPGQARAAFVQFELQEEA